MIFWCLDMALVPLQEPELRQKMLWERLQRDHALNHMCNQFNGRARRHGRGDVTTRKLKSTCGGTGVSFLSFSKRCVCVSSFSFCESYLVLSVLHIIMSKAKEKTKHKGSDSRSRYRLCVPPCPRYITSGDTHSLCVVCLGAKHAESALEGAVCPHCTVNAVVDRYQEAHKQAAPFQRFLPRRSRTQSFIHSTLLGGSSPLRIPAPHIGTIKSRASPLVRPLREADTSVALGRGQPTGPFFRLESTQQRSPDACGSGLRRVAPTRVQRCTPHHTVPVSPQCPQGIGLLTLPVFQGAAVPSEHSSQLFPPRDVAELRGTPPLRRSQIRSEDCFVTINLKDA